MKRIVILGKGGIGKSTVCSLLAYHFQKSGKSTLLIGCDPKHDSGLLFSDQPEIITLMDKFNINQVDKVSYNILEDIIIETESGVHILESGGPAPGKGCAGMAIGLMFDLINDSDSINNQYDILLFDVLGDVVCGGFAAPLRDQHPANIIIITSSEYSSLYAANNICNGIVNLSHLGASSLIGLIANKCKNEKDIKIVENFASKIGSQALGAVPYGEQTSQTLEIEVLYEKYKKDITAIAQKVSTETKSRVIPGPVDSITLRNMCRTLVDQ